MHKALRSNLSGTSSSFTSLNTCLFVALLAVLLLPLSSHAAAPDPNAVAQFNHVVGGRVEAMTILGGDYGASGGGYAFRGGSKADISITKLGGGGVVASPMSLGVGELKWAPVIQGNIGYMEAANTFATGILQGNTSKYSLFAIELGGGARIYFTEHLSLTPSVSGIYGHTKNTFDAKNTAGETFKTAATGKYADWQLDSWSVVPSLELKYDLNWGRTVFEFNSRFDYYHTESFDSTSPVVSVNGNSQTWANKLDVDVPMNWKLFGRELHTGGYFSRTELFGNASEGLNENHIYTASARLVLDTTGSLWMVRWVGLGVSYFWGDHFEGWSAGLNVRLKF